MNTIWLRFTASQAHIEWHMGNELPFRAGDVREVEEQAGLTLLAAAPNNFSRVTVQAYQEGGE